MRDSITGNPIERWDLERLSLGREWEASRQQILPRLHNTGLLAPRFPRYAKYDSLLIHGARLEDIEPRLKFIDEFWQRGGRFENVIVLTGERELSEDEKGPVSVAGTEIALMQDTWRVNKIIPAAIKQLPIYWINTPNFKDKNGRLRRGVTEDTINVWLSPEFSQTIVNGGRYLAVSNAPLILRQHVVFEKVFQEKNINCYIETAGFAEPKEGSQLIIYYLREIAGLLWELQQLTQTSRAGVQAGGQPLQVFSSLTT